MSAQIAEAQKTLFGLQTKPIQKSALQVKVDRLGEIEEILKEVKDLITEKEEIRKSLLAEIKEFPASEEALLEGTDYTVLFSAASKTRTISDIEGYFDAVGQDVFLKTVTVPIGKASEYLTPPQQEALVKVTTGSRSLKAVIRKH